MKYKMHLKCQIIHLIFFNTLQIEIFKIHEIVVLFVR